MELSTLDIRTSSVTQTERRTLRLPELGGLFDFVLYLIFEIDHKLFCKSKGWPEIDVAVSGPHDRPFPPLAFTDSVSVLLETLELCDCRSLQIASKEEGSFITSCLSIGKPFLCAPPDQRNRKDGQERRD